MNATPTTATVRLRNSITGAYYVTGDNFTGTESSASTFAANDPSVAVVKASYNNVDIETVPASFRPRLVSGGRGSKTYSYNGWLITVSRWSERSYACGTCRTRSGNQFYGYQKGTGRDLPLQGGGIRRAQQIIDRLTASANS